MVKNIFNEKIPKRIIIFIISFVSVFFILVSSLVTKKYDLNVGDIANFDIRAPREVQDSLKTKEKEEQEEASIPLQYNKDVEIKNNSLDDIGSFFFEVGKLKSSALTEEEKLANLKNQKYIEITDQDFQAVLELSDVELEKLQNSLVEILDVVLDYDIREGNMVDANNKNASKEDIKKAQEYIDVKFIKLNISGDLKELGIKIAYTKIKPNFFYDEEKTQQLKTEARKTVQPVMIKKGQTIVKEGEPITERDLIILEDLGLLDNKFNQYLYLAIGALVLLIQGLQWFFLYRYHAPIFRDWSKLILISILLIISLLLSRSIMIISAYAIPLACVPMLITLLINDKVSLMVNLSNCILISAVVQFNIEVTLIAIMSCILGTVAIKKLQQRNDILYGSLYIGLICGVLTLSVGFLLSNNVIEVLTKSVLVFMGSTISAVLTIGFLPLFESTFDIVTTIKLLELSNPNHPLQKKLLLEAPGTYHHSILVGNLAELAAERVGGNPVLARVSAYYHDIGKLKRPMFFKENQIGKENPHDKINPNLSTLIITAHVKDGVEMAREYRLPKVIQDAIEQHHGTSLVSFFYITAKNNAEKPEEIREEDFRYPGPIPKSKEVAIVMLADSVEAAVRSISEPTKGKIEEMVNKIIKGKLNTDQLDNCDLTLKDLNTIRKAFLKVLSGIYHQRIEYPSEKNMDK
ncbi:HDIG domain-containing protein [Clostridium sediminicola]|uniref:HD family phosphohydrolase n=1 Tax=Clostridium sediminicola TaxID=3114879 RepID=UPI0031F25E1C